MTNESILIEENKKFKAEVERAKKLKKLTYDALIEASRGYE